MAGEVVGSRGVPALRILGIAALLALPACAALSPRIDPAIAPVVGKTLRNEVATLMINRDGTITGKVGPEMNLDLHGRWEIRNGQFCRTLTAPPELLGLVAATACHDFAIDGDRFTITGPDGAGIGYAID